MCNETEEKRVVKSFGEKKKRVVDRFLSRERLRPNIERGGFSNFTKETYHGRCPFVPTESLPDHAMGNFKEKDKPVSND